MLRFSVGMSLMDTFAAIFTRRRLSLCFVTWNIAALMILNVSMIIHYTGAVVDGEIADIDSQYLEAHLKRLNKPAVKTMKTQNGDIFDCVPIYKQPAFDNPLLANHTIQMKPSFVPYMDDDAANQIGSDHPLILSSKHVGNIESCPLGTVPIRRTQISDLRRVPKLQDYGKRDESDNERQEQAGAKLERGGPFLGARGRINVWDIKVNDGEWSHSAIEISDKESHFIEAGWLVYPEMFGDQKSRLFTFWTADGYKDTGCYNLLCPGFIQVSRNTPLGGEIHPTSSYDWKQYALKTLIFRNPNDMNWWLEIHGEPVGYWPKELFGGRFVEAAAVKWIGSILNTMSGDQMTTTMMGSGRFPAEGYGKAAFFQTVEVIDEKGQFQRPTQHQFYQTNHKGCYEVDPVGEDIFFYFGGPGGGYDACKS